MVLRSFGTPSRSAMDARGNRPSFISIPIARTPVERWVTCVVAVVDAPWDLPSLQAWAAFVHLGHGTLCNRCRIVGASPKKSLSLARLSRTLRLGDPACWAPELWLDALDLRTISDLVKKGGLASHLHRTRPTLDMLFARQAFDLPQYCLQLLAESLRPSFG